ncbi:MAG: nucleotidyltransferase family protein [Betaproteobacteria bacterium HGW-Betaproteobacteria-12]|nr:MAG: nucleotidyltransferase family protein [Betaproteobacteria bacterium HGW-Betaproteobacteria-12]
MAGEIVAILLAAGAGSRFGSDKLLHRLPDGRPLAVAAAQSLRAACPRVVAVVRPEREALARELAAAGCELVFCPQAELGMGHSLAAGVQATADAAGWLVALADMPFIAAASHRAVASCLQAGARLAATSYAGRRGHPVGFAAEWFADLAALSGDQGAKTILESHRRLVVLCPVNDPGVLRDIDRPADLDAS